MSEDQQPQEPGVPVKAIVAYLTDVYRHLDTLSFNNRQNIQNMMQTVEGEVTQGESDDNQE